MQLLLGQAAWQLLCFWLTAVFMVVHPADCCVIHLSESSDEENKLLQDVMKTKQ